MSKENKDFLMAFMDMQGDLPLIGKTAKGFNYKYATLESILEQWVPVFEKHGFVLRQSTRSGENGEWDVVTSNLTHIESGISVESSLTLKVQSDFQAMGSGVTYLKRYTLTTLKQPVDEDYDGLKTKRDAEGGSAAKGKPSAKKKSGVKANGSKPLDTKDGEATSNGDNGKESGVHVAYEEFLKKCDNIVSLEEFYMNNRKELEKLKGGKPEAYAKCIDAFKSRKQELQDGE